MKNGCNKQRRRTHRLRAEVLDTTFEDGAIAGADGDIARHWPEHRPWWVHGAPVGDRRAASAASARILAAGGSEGVGAVNPRPSRWHLECDVISVCFSCSSCNIHHRGRRHQLNSYFNFTFSAAEKQHPDETRKNSSKYSVVVLFRITDKIKLIKYDGRALVY